MKFTASIAALFSLVSLRLVFTQDPIFFQEKFTVTNITLENKYENNTGWKLPRDTSPKWFEYYNSTSHFNEESGNNLTCAGIAKNFTIPSEADGVWVACQDPGLSGDQKDCAAVESSPCHPIITYDAGTSHDTTLRTVKMSFALFGLAILRLSIGAKCVDYSYRQDTFSPCEFIGFNETIDNGRWVGSQYSFDPLLNTSFSSFTLKLISRFAHDVVLLDKVEASQALLCGDHHCTTTPLPPTTRQTIGPIYPPTTLPTTTVDDGVSDPDIWTTTTPKSDSSKLFLSSIMVLILPFFSYFFLRKSDC